MEQLGQPLKGLAPQKRNQKSEVKVRKVSGPGWFVGAEKLFKYFFPRFFHRRAARPEYIYSM